MFPRERWSREGLALLKNPLGLRVLHVVPSLGLQRGGPSFTARALAIGLVHAGIEVHIATTDDDGYSRLTVPLGQPLRELDVTYWYFARQTRFYTASCPLARWLDQHVSDYDILHIHALFSFSSLAAAACAARHGVPYIVRPLGTLNRWGMQNRRPLLKQLSFNLLERHVLAGAASVHYTSEQERAEAAELGINQPSVIIPNPVEITNDRLDEVRGKLRERYPRLAGRTLILFLARLDPKKGINLLLPAFAQAWAQCPNLALVLAGSDNSEYVASLQAEVVRLNITDAVVWPGFLQGDDKLAALADADLFVLPSYSENFGNAVVEAMACGLPVVISDQVGIHDEVATAGAGLVIPCEIGALAGALTTLANDPALRQAMGWRGRQLAQERFAPAVVTSHLIALYAAVTDNQPIQEFLV